MDLPALWPRLDPEARDWLVAHNGEPLTPAVLESLALANGGSVDPMWWSENGEDGPVLSDQTIDWIEGVANGEEVADG